MIGKMIFLSLSIVCCIVYSNAQDQREACNYLGCAINQCDLASGSLSCDASKCNEGSYTCQPQVQGPCDYIRCSINYCESDVELNCDTTNCEETYECSPALNQKCSDALGTSDGSDPGNTGPSNGQGIEQNINN